MLDSSINQVKNGYYKLIILVGDANGARSHHLKKICDEFGYKYINLNFELCRRLRGLGKNQYGSAAVNILTDIVSGESVVIFDNIGTLFSRDLNLNPLQVLKQISRNTVIVAAWVGDYNGHDLTHGLRSDDEYVEYDKSQIGEIKIVFVEDLV